MFREFTVCARSFYSFFVDCTRIQSWTFVVDGA
jgi:hypothetical protein